MAMVSRYQGKLSLEKSNLQDRVDDGDGGGDDDDGDGDGDCDDGEGNGRDQGSASHLGA